MARREQLNLFPATNADAGAAPAGNVRHQARQLAPAGDPPPILVPTPPPPGLPAGARWRITTTPTQSIGYVLRRSRRKSIGLQINDDGLQVTAPAWATMAQIDDAVRHKAAWALDKLRAHQARQARLAMADTQWQSGGHIAYLGNRIILALDGTLDTPRFEGELHAPADGDRLYLPLPGNAERDRVRDSTQVWLQQQAASWFEQRLSWFLAQHALPLRAWRLSSAATRWGSCTSDGRIMLNWRLIHFEHRIIDYVIAHELAHLRVMNHSRDFWREVGRLMPGFESARDAVRQHDPGSLPLL